MKRTVLFGVLLLAVALFADDADQRAKLDGSWRAESANSKDASSYVLERSDDGMHVTGTSGAKTIVDFNCKMGQECPIKDAGHNAKVTIYFNGPKLVENETIGSRVVRRRFTVVGDGNEMQVEVIPIEPEGKTETIVFHRAANEAAKR
jgi:hypothetical protein